MDKSEPASAAGTDLRVCAGCIEVEDGPLLALHALSQRTRLAIFRLLVCNAPEGLPVGAIARGLGAPQNTISAHLSMLHRAKLVNSERRGRSVAYRADLRGMQSLFEYLVRDCCHGDASLCAAMFTPRVGVAAPMSARRASPGRDQPRRP
jgi:DNA-binding transcriptional ArsR family regulator